MHVSQLPPWPVYRRQDPSRAVRRRSEIGVGSVVFVRDINNRVYGGPGGRMSERHTFVAREVVGETKVSWLVGWSSNYAKYPKKDPAGVYGLDDVEDALWIDTFAWRIGDAVKRHRSADDLKTIAKLIGFEPEPIPSPEASAS